MRLRTLLAASILTSAALPCAAETGDYQRRLAALEADLAALKQDAAAIGWVDKVDHDALRQMVLASVTATSLAEEGTAGIQPGRGIFLASADGRFIIYGEALAQMRAVWNSTDGGDSSRFGFDHPLTRVQLSGTLDDLAFRVRFRYGFSGGTTILEDAAFTLPPMEQWRLVVGQQKAPFLREELVDDSMQLATQRSMVRSLTTMGRSQGIWLTRREDLFNLAFAFTDGASASATGATVDGSNGAALIEDREWAVTGRIDTRIEGAWSQFDDFTTRSGDGRGLLVGAAFHAQEGEFGTASPETMLLSWTADAQFENGPMTLFGYVVGAHFDSPAGLSDYDQFGAVAQGSLDLVEDTWEAFARIEYFDFDGAVGGGDDTFEALTVGVTRYLHWHTLKWTTEIGWAWEPVPVGVEGLGWRADGAGESDQIVLRSQVQAYFR